MNLVSMHFNYEISEKKFSYMSYEFNPVENNLELKKIVELAKSTLQDLELIIKSNYSKKMIKEEIGDIDSYKIKYGYRYKENPKIFSIESFTNSTQLTYSIGLSQQGSPTRLDINLMNHNRKNMLKLHDDILIMPELKVTDEVKKQLENIEYLRNNKFDATKYLLLN